MMRNRLEEEYKTAQQKLLAISKRKSDSSCSFAVRVCRDEKQFLRTEIKRLEE